MKQGDGIARDYTQQCSAIVDPGIEGPIIEALPILLDMRMRHLNRAMLHHIMYSDGLKKEYNARPGQARLQPSGVVSRCVLDGLPLASRCSIS